MGLLTRLRPRSVYDVLALLAILIALAGGGAYAAATIGSADIRNNAILSRHIKDGEVKHADIAPDSVGSSKVIDGSLRRQDFAAGQLPRGAVSVHMHLKDSMVQGALYHGLSIGFGCRGTSDPPNPLAFSITATPSNVFVIGMQMTSEQPTAARFGGSVYTFYSADSSIDLDVMARVDPGGKWVHLQLTGTWSGTATGGCDFGGLLTPYSN